MAVLSLLVFSIISITILNVVPTAINGAIVLPLQRAHRDRPVRELLQHDFPRHGRKLAAVSSEFLGGGFISGGPGLARVYYVKLTVGTPPRSFEFNVDMSVGGFYVNCSSNITTSKTLEAVPCDSKFCERYKAEAVNSTCKDNRCGFNITYIDNSTAAGYFVKDYVSYNTLSLSDSGTTPSKVTFGCATNLSYIDSLSTLDHPMVAVLGLGRSNTSLLSQLVDIGEVPHAFFHCLDSQYAEYSNRGGIFAFGELVDPEVKMTLPLILNNEDAFLRVNLRGIRREDDNKKIADINEIVVLDIGTNFAYVSPEIDRLLNEVFFGGAKWMSLRWVLGDKCFIYHGDDIDHLFPNITFVFDKTLEIALHPHHFIHQLSPNIWCTHWYVSGKSDKDGKSINIFGDIFLMDKIFAYDLEKNVVGWTKYNCSSGLKVRDKKTGKIVDVLPAAPPPPTPPQAPVGGPD